jgi:hypothetical protein
VRTLKLTDDERSAKRSFQALSVDDEGNEVYVGLSREESEWMLDYERKYAPGRTRSPERDEKKRHIELHEKHELARLRAIGLNHSIKPIGSA